MPIRISVINMGSNTENNIFADCININKKVLTVKKGIDTVPIRISVIAKEAMK